MRKVIFYTAKSHLLHGERSCLARWKDTIWNCNHQRVVSKNNSTNWKYGYWNIFQDRVVHRRHWSHRHIPWITFTMNTVKSKHTKYPKATIILWPQNLNLHTERQNIHRTFLITPYTFTPQNLLFPSYIDIAPLPHDTWHNVRMIRLYTSYCWRKQPQPMREWQWQQLVSIFRRFVLQSQAKEWKGHRKIYWLGKVYLLFGKALSFVVCMGK